MDQYKGKEKPWEFMKYEGVWQDEPIVYRFIEKGTGLHCLILRHPILGHLCGYVSVPEDYRFYGKDHHDSIFENIEIHWGLTYSGDLKDQGVESHSKEFYLGFDCAHCDDFVPSLWSLTKIGEISNYKTIDYVKAQCINLAKQLFDLNQNIN